MKFHVVNYGSVHVKNERSDLVRHDSLLFMSVVEASPHQSIAFLLGVPLLGGEFLECDEVKTDSGVVGLYSPAPGRADTQTNR